MVYPEEKGGIIILNHSLRVVVNETVIMQLSHSLLFSGKLLLLLMFQV